MLQPLTSPPVQAQSILSTRNSVPGTQVTLACPLYKDGCEHRLNLRRGADSTQPFRVVLHVLEHSHEFTEDERVLGVWNMRGKLEQLRGEIERRERGEGMVKYPTRGAGVRSGRGIAAQEGFPHLEDVVDEVALLAEAGGAPIDLAFIAATSFSTPRDLLLQLYSAPKQSNYHLVLTSLDDSESSGVLVCDHVLSKGPRTCPFFVGIDLVEGGWRLTLGSEEHSHDLNVDSEDDDESDSSDSSDQGCTGARLVHTPFVRLMPRINALKNSGPLEMPSPTNGFTAETHNDFRIHACAAALQRRFSLRIWTTCKTRPMEGKRFDLVCHRMPKGGTCKVRMRVEKSEVGGVEGWRVTSLFEEHDHELDEEDEEEEESPVRVRGKKRRRTPTPSSDSGSEDDARPSPYLSLSPPPKYRQQARPPPSSSTSESRRASTSSSHHRALSHPIASSSRTPHRLPAAPQPLPPPLHLPAPPKHSFLPSLTQFLHHLSPSLVSYASTLLLSGISSQTALLHLVYLDDSLLKTHPRDSELGLPRIAQVMLGRKLRWAREEIEGGRSGGSG